MELKYQNPIEWRYFERIYSKRQNVHCARMYYKMKVPITEIAVCSFLQNMRPVRYMKWLVQNVILKTNKLYICIRMQNIYTC